MLTFIEEGVASGRLSGASPFVSPTFRLDWSRELPSYALEDRAVVERIVNKSTDHQAARRWDIIQNRRMTPEERQAVARELRLRVYGTNNPDVRDAERSRLSELIRNKRSVGRNKDRDDLDYLTGTIDED